jgi:hypothetical protein
LYELDVYFSFQEAQNYVNEICKWTGIYFSVYILSDIYGLTLGYVHNTLFLMDRHPGFVAFIANLITSKLRNTRLQLDLRTFRQLIVGKSFNAALSQSDIGKRINYLIREEDKPVLFQLFGGNVSRTAIIVEHQPNLQYLIEIGVLKEGNVYYSILMLILFLSLW